MKSYDEKTPLLPPTPENGGMDKDRPKKLNLNVQRPVYELEEINVASEYEYPSTNFKQSIKNKFSDCHALSCVLRTIPVLKWLPRYQWKKNILGDVLSGSTIAVMHIPQGMAYAILGNLPPIVGLYMAFFPVLVYFIFGTSRHVSMGTFAVVCLMTGKTVSKFTSEEFLPNGTVINLEDQLHGDVHYTSIQVATTVTFTVAVFQMIMYILRLGVITTLLSETLVNAFTSAAAFHVVFAQVKDLFGLSISRNRGLFSIIYTIYDTCSMLPNANVVAVSISFVYTLLMVLNNQFLKPWVAKKTRIPIPIELFAITTGTILSHFLNFNENYNISIVGNIPTGLPKPDLPVFSLIPDIAMDSFVITMVSYTIAMSMSLIFAQKLCYEVDSNQEFFAMSCSNCVGSFFSCMPITASLSRSLIQQAVGGVSQLASVVSCLIILVVLLWVGPLFEQLPRCVLACIIIVALQKLLFQCASLKKYWKLSKLDGIVWIATFLTTTFIAIDIGLLVGVVTSLLAMFVQGYRPYACILGVVPNTDIYLDIMRYKKVQEVPEIKIFHYAGCLNFASRSSFRFLISKRVGFDPTRVLSKRRRQADRFTPSMEMEDLFIRHLILDFSAITYIDPSGVEVLRYLIGAYNELNIQVYISGCSGPIFETLQKCDKYEQKKSNFIMFPTIHDAVLYCQETLKK